MNNLKPLSQTLHERFYGGPSLGVSYPVNESLPESGTPVCHVENDQESGLLIDRLRTPKEKVIPQSLFEIVASRLQSIKPRSKARSKEVAQMVADLMEPLALADELIATLEAERVEDL